MRALAPLPAWRAWLRRRERTLAAWYLVAVAALMLALAAGPTRRVLLGGLQSVSDRWDARWDRRLAWGDSLVAAGRWQDAATWLERLDRVFPARNARQVRDKQREHLLQQLARSYEALGRTGRATATYDRLIAFDSFNYHNHYLRARAVERMLSGWALAVEARDGFANALALFPNHLPSLRGYIDYYADRGDWRPVCDAYRAYLDAFLVQEVTLRFGDTTITVNVAADGHPHAIVVSSPRPHADTLGVSAAGFALALDSVDVAPLAVVGGAGSVAPVGVPAAGIVARGVLRAELGVWRPVTDSAQVLVPLPTLTPGVAEVRLVIRLFKPVDRTLWLVVAQARRNLLDVAGLAADSLRTVPFSDAAAADAVLARQWWARSGLQLAVDAP